MDCNHRVGDEYTEKLILFMVSSDLFNIKFRAIQS